LFLTLIPIWVSNQIVRLRFHPIAKPRAKKALFARVTGSQSRTDPETATANAFDPERIRVPDRAFVREPFARAVSIEP
jgi:hypothetical protein